MATNKIGFTAPKISALECEKGKSQTIYWDSKTPSLGVRELIKYLNGLLREQKNLIGQ